MDSTTQTAQTIALIVNGIKHSIKDFTLEELSTLLKENQCPYWKKIATILNSKNLLHKDGNKYNFCTSSPIYYSIFSTELLKIKKDQAKYNQKWLGKSKCSEEEVAIKYLKSLGYKIFKEV